MTGKFIKVKRQLVIMNVIIDTEDYEIVERACRMDKLVDKQTDVLFLYKHLGYEITAELIAEVVEIDGLNIDELQKTSMTFYVNPIEKDKQFARFLKERVDSIGEHYDVLALAYANRKHILEQKNKNLIRKRLQVPKYVAILTKACGLINCTTEKEIKEYNLPF